MVSVQRFLSSLSIARPHLETPVAVGLEHRRLRTDGALRLQRQGRSSRSEGTPQRAGGTDLPEILGTAIPVDALYLQCGARSPRHRPADHASAVAALSR